MTFLSTMHPQSAQAHGIISRCMKPPSHWAWPLVHLIAPSVHALFTLPGSAVTFHLALWFISPLLMWSPLGVALGLAGLVVM